MASRDTQDRITVLCWITVPKKLSIGRPLRVSVCPDNTCLANAHFIGAIRSHLLFIVLSVWGTLMLHNWCTFNSNPLVSLISRHHCVATNILLPPFQLHLTYPISMSHMPIQSFLRASIHAAAVQGRSCFLFCRPGPPWSKDMARDENYWTSTWKVAESFLSAAVWDHLLYV